VPLSDQEIIETLKMYGHDVSPCGSQVTCDPVPVNTDIDYLVYVKPPKQGTISKLDSMLGYEDFKIDGAGHYQDQILDGFCSYRRGNLNLIVTANWGFKQKHHLATAVCTNLNLLNKPDRIMLFQAILYGKGPDKRNYLSETPQVSAEQYAKETEYGNFLDDDLPY
jgi:hypothetical protein